VSPFFVYIICCSRISSITWQASAFHSDVAEYISICLLVDHIHPAVSQVGGTPTPTVIESSDIDELEWDI